MQEFYLSICLPVVVPSKRVYLYIHLFAVIITLSTIILLHICRCGVQCRDSQRSEYIFASDSSEPACLAQLRLIADLDSVSFSVSFPVGLLSVSVKEPLKKKKSKPESRGRLFPQRSRLRTTAFYYYSIITTTITTISPPSSTLPPWKYLERQWISRSGLDFSPSQVTTCALPILFAVRFRSH